MFNALDGIHRQYIYAVIWQEMEGKGGREEQRKERIHHRPSHIPNRYHTFLLALLLFREESKGFLDFILLFVGNVVLFCELGLSRFWGCCLCSAAFSWLDGDVRASF
jgi:hypothetical protein